MNSKKPIPILEIVNLVKHFPIRHSRNVVHAVNGVSFEVGAGETLALVGESGSGKTTVGRCALRLLEPTAGGILFKGTDITNVRPRDLEKLRPSMQMVFQEPFESLNPRFTCAGIIGENLKLMGMDSSIERRKRIEEVFELVRLPAELGAAFPHELTGGEQQRVSIGRALSTKPDLIVLDEPTSALDVSVRGETLHLLRDLQKETQVSYLLISHDLTVVKQISHQIAIMYLGSVVESGDTAGVFAEQEHPYSMALLASVLIADPATPPNGVELAGEIPSPVDLPSGCVLHPRCPYAVEQCKSEVPILRRLGGRMVACHRTEEIKRGTQASKMSQG